MKRVVIVGAGIGGLALAHALSRAAGPRLDLLVLEARDRAGGNIRTEIIDGYTCEHGPSGFLDSGVQTLELARAVGLERRLAPSSEAARRRFIYRKGRLHQVPATPGEFLRSRLLSWPGKLRLLLEPAARRPPGGDETVHAFATRRVGREAADVLIDAMVSGVFAGDSRALSLAACFPRIGALERTHGGLFRALLALRRERHRAGVAGQHTRDAPGGPAGRLTSFAGGMEELVGALVAALGAAVRTGTRVRALEVDAASRVTGHGPFLLRLADGTAVAADSVVLAGPAADSSVIVDGLDAALAADLRAIPAAPLAVVCLGYDAAAVAARRGPLDGFGFLVPRGEGVRLLGALWESSIYPGRAPGGRVLIRAMIGGAHDPEAAALSDEALVAAVRSDLAATMRLDPAPQFVRTVRHRRGIPQYTSGHLDRLRRIDRRLEAWPGLYLTGSSYRGVSLNACVEEAGPLAERVLGHLAGLREPEGPGPGQADGRGPRSSRASITSSG